MTSTWYSARRVADKYSGYKVLVEEGTDRILGAQLIGDQAGEVINVFAVAIRSGMRAADLKHMVFAYPTRCKFLEKVDAVNKAKRLLTATSNRRD